MTETRVTLTAPIVDGGIGRNLVNLARGWLDEGVAVDLVVDALRGNMVEAVPEGVTVFESGGSHAVRDVPWLARHLRRRPTAGVLTPVPRHTVWALRARALGRVRCRVVANIHNNYAQTLTAVSASKRRRRVALMARHYPRCDAVVAVSAGAAEAFCGLTGIPRGGVAVLPNPVVHPGLVCEGAAGVDHPWFRPDQPPVIAWSGRMEPQKDVELLLAAFERLRGHMECRLMLVGAGSEERRLRQQASTSPSASYIDFVGFQSNPHRFVARASVFVLCSKWEGFGNVLAEAMALGTPVVAVDCPSGPADILDGGRLGPLVPMADPEALSQGMYQALTRPVSASVLREAAEQYSAATVARRYLALLCPGGG